MAQGNPYQASAVKLKPRPANPNTRFWGIWLPVPTIIAILVTLFFNWLILSTVGYTEHPIEKAGQPIIDEF